MKPRSTLLEVRRLQREVGVGRCPFCARPLKRKATGRPPQICWSADCRTELQRAHNRASAALRKVVREIGSSVKRLEALK